MNKKSQKADAEPHNLLDREFSPSQRGILAKAKCSCGEDFAGIGSSEDSAFEDLLGKHIKHFREVRKVQTAKREIPWREGKDGIITGYDDILAMGFPQDERERRKELLESDRQFTGTLIDWELDIELWGDWIIYILGEMYTSSFDLNLVEGIEEFGGGT